MRRPPAAAGVVGLVLVCLLALTACGDSLQGEPDASPDATAAPSAQPSTAPSPNAAPSPSTAAPSPSTGPSPPSGPTSDAPGPSPTPAPPSPSTAPQPTPTPPAPLPSPPPDPDVLQLGDEGEEVVGLQQRLRELGYWLPTVDGVFGPGTHHAVVALQKAAGISRDGVVGPVTEQVLADGPRPRPRSTSGTVIEIDRGSQLLLLVTDGELRWVFDTSTGNAAHLTTPAGWFRVSREIDGYRRSPLGVLYRPKYFNSGIAMHGYPSVPPYPASHGCVRLTNGAMDWLWANDAVPLGRAVWVY